MHSQVHGRTRTGSERRSQSLLPSSLKVLFHAHNAGNRLVTDKKRVRAGATMRRQSASKVDCRSFEISSDTKPTARSVPWRQTRMSSCPPAVFRRLAGLPTLTEYTSTSSGAPLCITAQHADQELLMCRDTTPTVCHHHLEPADDCNPFRIDNESNAFEWQKLEQ